MISIPLPKTGEYSPFYDTYISKVTDTTVGEPLYQQTDRLNILLEKVSSKNESFRYAEGKWSIKEMVRHISDAERVFSYRAMCIARGEKGSLPGFEQNDYVANSVVDHLNLSQLLNELHAVRQGSILLAENMETEAWHKIGTASGGTISVRALFYILIGHFEHHVGVLEEKYITAFV